MRTDEFGDDGTQLFSGIKKLHICSKANKPEILGDARNKFQFIIISIFDTVKFVSEVNPTLMLQIY